MELNFAERQALLKKAYEKFGLKEEETRRHVRELGGFDQHSRSGRASIWSSTIDQAVLAVSDLPDSTLLKLSQADHLSLLVLASESYAVFKPFSRNLIRKHPDKEWASLDILSLTKEHFQQIRPDTRARDRSPPTPGIGEVHLAEILAFRVIYQDTNGFLTLPEATRTLIAKSEPVLSAPPLSASAVPNTHDLLQETEALLQPSHPKAATYAARLHLLN